MIVKAAHIYQLLMEEASGLRNASAELIAAIIEDLGKQYMLGLQVGFSCLLFSLCRTYRALHHLNRHSGLTDIDGGTHIRTDLVSPWEEIYKARQTHKRIHCRTPTVRVQGRLAELHTTLHNQQRRFVMTGGCIVRHGWTQESSYF